MSQLAVMRAQLSTQMAADLQAVREEVSADMAEFFADHPIEIDDDYLAQKVSAGVFEYFAAHPVQPGADGAAGSPGRNPTFAEILDVVAVYLQTNPPAKGETGATGAAGQTGATGAAGRAPTAQEIAAGVAAYLAANPPAAGAAGQAGATGAAGQNATDAQVASQVAVWISAHPIGNRVDLGEVTFTDGGLIAVAGVREKTALALSGVKAGDRLALFPGTYRINGAAAIVGTPPLFMLGEAVCEVDGTIKALRFTGPALVLATVYTVTLRVSAFR